MRLIDFTKMFVLALALAIVPCGFAGEAKKDAPKKEEPKKEDAPKKDAKDMNADEAEAAGKCPVCKKDSKPVYHCDAGGKTYHFFSRKCQTEFAGDPTKFGAKK